MKEKKIQSFLFGFLVFSPFLSTDQKGSRVKNGLRGEVRGGTFAKEISIRVIMMKKMKNPKMNVTSGGRREFVVKF